MSSFDLDPIWEAIDAEVTFEDYDDDTRRSIRGKA